MAKILYVEDEPINALILKKLLQKHHEVEVAHDGDTCLELINDNKYNLILMDINLGEEDGISVTQKLRKLPNGKASKVVAVTAFSLPEDRERFLQSGFDEYLPKPIEETSLLKLIQKLLAN